MPRKVNYGLDYTDDYDVYDDEYDYELDQGYDYDVEAKKDLVPETKAKQETGKVGVWRCPICTFDNDDSMSACDICGVLRNSLVKRDNKNKNDAVDGTCKDYGASIMAKSLFASLTHEKPPQAVTFEAWNAVLKTEEDFKYHVIGNIRGRFDDFLKAFSSQNKYKVDIAPFKFDVPSPDDLVLNGIHSSKVGKEANFNKSHSSNNPSGKKQKDIITELTATGQDCSSSSVSKGRTHEVQESDLSLEAKDKTQDLISDISSISVSSKPDKAKITNEARTLSRTQYKPEKWMLPDKEDTLSELNLAIVGHVDSGKSTISGRLLHLLGRISQKEMHKYEKEAKQQGKGSFAYAWALDESAEERERGITMTVAVAYFNSKKYHVVLLDSPGHRDFVPNMISGATQADAAILVIDASTGSFEAGLDAAGGQTREHAQLIRSFGVDQVIVAINKMDAVGYSKERFDLIKQQLGAFLRSCGFKDSSLTWIPLSAMENQNLVGFPSEKRLSWFQGPCLLDAIDSFHPPTRDYSKPLRLPIGDVMKPQSQAQVSACGKLETGAIRTGSKVLVMPSRDIATVRSLERDSQVCSIARAGDNVIVNLQNIDPNNVRAGDVLCHPDSPVAVANRLELKVLVLEITTPIVIGSQLEFHVHHAKEAARVAKIVSLLDPKTGKVTKKAPRCLLAKQNAVLEVALQEEVCVEEYSNCRPLGRVSLRASGRTIALGVVTRIIERKE